jgi:hypothetical protein
MFKKYVEENQLFTRHGHAAMAVMGCACGIALGLGAGLAFLSESVWGLGWYLMFLGFFHFSEYICVALFNPKICSAECTCPLPDPSTTRSCASSLSTNNNDN